ncbi:uncharacterized protein LOC116007026 isoform X2 [Ipomoea triloba]|uniref:uncharacterized protein LOC116007026 isoform X2 n=1 Tax=Ipomoea triloba TaxID=35885 RepID=UPI00125E108E|nr:uncharacterized protein LOC116007026 isoform X2 [Ipomoea triloba]
MDSSIPLCHNFFLYWIFTSQEVGELCIQHCSLCHCGFCKHNGAARNFHRIKQKLMPRTLFHPIWHNESRETYSIKKTLYNKFVKKVLARIEFVTFRHKVICM